MGRYKGFKLSLKRWVGGQMHRLVTTVDNALLHVWNLLSVYISNHHHTHTRKKELINFTVLITAQCIHLSNYVVHFKYTILFVNYTSIKLGKNLKNIFEHLSISLNTLQTIIFNERMEFITIIHLRLDCWQYFQLSTIMNSAIINIFEANFKTKEEP